MAEFSNEAIRIWVTLRAIVAANAHREWEPEGRQREYFDLRTRLNSELLGLLPHECAPIHAAQYGPPPTPHDNERWTKLDCREQWSRESFVRAWKLAAMLDEAVEAQHRQRPRAKEREPVP